MESPHPTDPVMKKPPISVYEVTSSRFACVSCIKMILCIGMCINKSCVSGLYKMPYKFDFHTVVYYLSNQSLLIHLGIIFSLGFFIVLRDLDSLQLGCISISSPSFVKYLYCADPCKYLKVTYLRDQNIRNVSWIVILYVYHYSFTIHFYLSIFSVVLFLGSHDTSHDLKSYLLDIWQLYCRIYLFIIITVFWCFLYLVSKSLPNTHTE